MAASVLQPCILPILCSTDNNDSSSKNDKLMHVSKSYKDIESTDWRDKF